MKYRCWFFWARATVIGNFFFLFALIISLPLLCETAQIFLAVSWSLFLLIAKLYHILVDLDLLLSDLEELVGG